MHQTPAIQALATPGAWGIVKSFNGFRITRTWSNGCYQVKPTPWLRTEAEAVAALGELQRVAP